MLSVCWVKTDKALTHVAGHRGRISQQMASGTQAGGEPVDPSIPKGCGKRNFLERLLKLHHLMEDPPYMPWREGCRCTQCPGTSVTICAKRFSD